MPKVQSYTPSWLQRPSPGFKFFSDQCRTKASTAIAANAPPSNHPLRTVAHRGTQLFYAVGNELRWSDLVLLKDYESDDRARSRRPTPASVDSDPESLFRVLKVPVSGNITQLSISPNGEYIAIATSHTVHVALLPPGSYELDPDPFKLQAWQLGPTQHILEGSPVVSVLWHPLGRDGHCLVTLTKEAVVRLWEVEHDNRWTFDQSTLSIDLKKLANAEFAEQNLEASRFGSSVSFSPDIAELEPAGACFGGFGRQGEYPWAAMTLWIATIGGSVYALSPLLPYKFQAYPGLIKSLMTELDVSLHLNSGSSGAEDEKLRRQSDFIQDLVEQEPFHVDNPRGEGSIAIYHRPVAPGPNPKLQGPFEFDEDFIGEDDISDIVVRNIQMGEDPLELDTGEILEDDEDIIDPVGTTVILLVSQPGTVRVLLDLEGVQAQWLPSKTPHSTPKKRRATPQPNEYESHTLYPFETLNVLPKKTNVAHFPDIHPSFTADAQSHFAFWVTHEQGVSYISTEPWTDWLRRELENPSEAGIKVRLESSPPSSVEKIVKFDQDFISSKTAVPSTALVVSDIDLGYLVFTVVNSQPRAAILNTKFHDPLQSSTFSNHQFDLGRSLPPTLVPVETREVYQADGRFHQPSKAPAYVKNLQDRPTFSTKDRMKINSTTLELLLEAHQVFGTESIPLADAAAGLYRAVGRLQNEYKDQIERVREVESRVNALLGRYNDDTQPNNGEKLRGSADKRVAEAKARQQRIQQRVQQLQRKLKQVSGKQLSEREKEFASELRSVEQDVEEGEESHQAGQIPSRVNKLKQLIEEMKKDAEQLAAADKADDAAARKRLHVPSGFRNSRFQEVDKLLAREEAMVDAASDRLQRLTFLSS